MKLILKSRGAGCRILDEGSWRQAAGSLYIPRGWPVVSWHCSSRYSNSELTLNRAAEAWRKKRLHLAAADTPWSDARSEKPILHNTGLKKHPVLGLTYSLCDRAWLSAAWGLEYMFLRSSVILGLVKYHDGRPMERNSRSQDTSCRDSWPC